jgi:hypothetical protein
MRESTETFDWEELWREVDAAIASSTGVRTRRPGSFTTQEYAKRAKCGIWAARYRLAKAAAAGKLKREMVGGAWYFWLPEDSNDRGNASGNRLHRATRRR